MIAKIVDLFYFPFVKKHWLPYFTVNNIVLMVK